MASTVRIVVNGHIALNVSISYEYHSYHSLAIKTLLSRLYFELYRVTRLAQQKRWPVLPQAKATSYPIPLRLDLDIATNTTQLIASERKILT
jgi:hypothetical protein